MQKFQSSVPQLGNDKCLNMAKAFAERLNQADVQSHDQILI